MEKFEILKANINDCEEIMELQQLAYQSEAKIYNDWSLPALTQTVDSLLQEVERDIVLKAVMNKKIIGSVRAKLIERVCKIGRLIVDPDFQGQGIGSSLLKNIESCYSNISTYELFTGSKSEANIRLYQRHGYTISHTQMLSKTISLVFLIKQP
jgi:ribosomal protein S18 acetylase RimI-like enzyme